MKKHLTNMLLAWTLAMLCFVGSLVTDNTGLLLLFFVGAAYAFVIYTREFGKYRQERRR